MIMALFAIPQGIFKLAAWLVMTLVGWLVASAQTLYADITYGFSGGTLTISGGIDSTSSQTFNLTGQDVDPSANEDWRVFLNGSGVIIGGDTLEATAVQSILINAGPGPNDIIDVRGVSDNTGYTQLFNSGVTLSGGDGYDQIHGRDAADGHDRIDGGDGGDLLYGYNGADHIEGGAGNDVLHGGNGADTIQGNDGADTITDGPGGLSDRDWLYHADFSTGDNPDGYQDSIQGHDVGSEDQVAANEFANQDHDHVSSL